MNCKFCNAQLEDDSMICPDCGKDNAEAAVGTDEVMEPAAEQFCEVDAESCEEPETAQVISETAEEADAVIPEEPKRKPKIWVIILAVIGALSLLTVLVGAVLYGIGAFEKKAKSYTVSAEKADDVRDTVVATVGDIELTNNQLQVFYQQSINEFYNYYGYYLDTSVLDLTKPLDEQYYDAETGITWQQYFLDTTLTTWSRYAALCMQAREEGYVLTEEMQSYLDAIPAQLEEMAISYGYESTEAMLLADLGPICNEDGYMEYMYTNLYAGQYVDARYDSMVPTVEEIQAYYTANEATLAEQGIVNDGSVTVDARHILICPQGGTTAEDGSVTYSEEEWEACRVKAQEILDKWLAESGTEDGFAQFAATYTEDPGSMNTGGLYSDIYEGQMVTEFNDWCFDPSRAYGDTGLVKTTYGYHIMYFVASEELWLTSVRDTIINERSLALVDEAAAKWPIEINEKKIALGTPAATESAE